MLSKPIPPRIESQDEFEALVLFHCHEQIHSYADVARLAAALRNGGHGHAALADLRFWYMKLLDQAQAARAA